LDNFKLEMKNEEEEDVLVENLLRKATYRLQHKYQNQKKEPEKKEFQKTQETQKPKLVLKSTKEYNHPILKFIKYVLKIIFNPITILTFTATSFFLFFKKKSPSPRIVNESSEPFPLKFFHHETSKNVEKVEFIPVEKISTISNFQKNERKTKEIQNPFIQTIHLSSYNDMFENDEAITEYNKIVGKLE
jgi:hypothetical protein